MIGVFDSGVGGLSVLSELLKNCPGYKYVYLGDSANVPYGNKPMDDIYQYSQRAVDFLYNQGCQVIIFACNSASAQALRKIQQEYLPIKYPNLKVLGVIRPIAEKVAQLKNIRRVGIIGTRATVNSSIYHEEIELLKADVEIVQKATPLLVPLIEEGWAKKPETKMILKKYLRPLKIKQVEVLVLACTHYPFLLSDIKRIMGKKCKVLDTSQVVGESFLNYLKCHPEIKLEKQKNSQCYFYTTGNVDNFKNLGEDFLKKKISQVFKAEL